MPPNATTRKCSVILMTGRGTIETVMAATRGGAFDYIAKPFELDTMLNAIERAEAVRDGGEKEAEEEEMPETRNDRLLALHGGDI